MAVQDRQLVWITQFPFSDAGLTSPGSELSKVTAGSHVDLQPEQCSHFHSAFSTAESLTFRDSAVQERGRVGTNVSSRPSSCFIVTKHWPKPAWGGEGLSGLQVPTHHQQKPEQVLRAGIQRETLLCGVPLQVCLQVLAFLISLNIT